MATSFMLPSSQTYDKRQAVNPQARCFVNNPLVVKSADALVWRHSDLDFQRVAQWRKHLYKDYLLVPHWISCGFLGGRATLERQGKMLSVTDVTTLNLNVPEHEDMCFWYLPLVWRSWPPRMGLWGLCYLLWTPLWRWPWCWSYCVGGLQLDTPSRKNEPRVAQTGNLPGPAGSWDRSPWKHESTYLHSTKNDKAFESHLWITNKLKQQAKY